MSNYLYFSFVLFEKKVRRQDLTVLCGMDIWPLFALFWRHLSLGMDAKRIGLSYGVDKPILCFYSSFFLINKAFGQIAKFIDAAVS